MTYLKKLIAVVKCSNKVLREQEGCVFLPFGSEYSILIKNLESRKAIVKISIDGTDILYGKQLIINPNSEIEIERFLENLSEGKRLKFIQKTKEISEHRGDKVDDGFIRIEFQFEKEKPIRVTGFIQEDHYIHNHSWTIGYPMYTITSLDPMVSTNCYYLSNIGKTNESLGASAVSTGQVNCCLNSFSVPSNLPEEGITVKGSDSFQKFQETTAGELEENSHTIILTLKGFQSKGQIVEKVVTTRDKVVCSICGKHNKTSFKFCTRCSASLT